MTINRDSSRRGFFKAAIGAGAGMLLGSAWNRAVADTLDPRVTQIMSRTISIDMHNHVYPNGISRSQPGPPGFLGGLFGRPQESTGNIVLADQLKQAGLTAVCAAYELDFTPISNPGDARNNYLRWIDALDRQLQQEQLHRAFHLKDLQTAHDSGRPTVIQAVEGAHFIEGHVERVEEVYRRGLRHLQLLHDRPDLVAPLGHTDSDRDLGAGGMTAMGKQVVKECNRLGIVVDLAHAGPQTISDAAQIATQPFVVSHAGPQRNAASNDRMMGMLQSRLLNKDRAKVIADAGGVIGVWVYGADSVQEYVENLRAMVDLAGIDHVGIGTDTNILSSGRATNDALPNMSNGFFYSVAAEMLRQGFRPDEISKIGGGNYCRVFDKVTAGHA